MVSSTTLETFSRTAARLGTDVIHTDFTSLPDRLGALADSQPEWSVRVSREVARLIPPLEALSRGAATWPERMVGRGRYVVAETGSVVVAEPDHGDRLAALLCQHHVVLVPSLTMVEDRLGSVPRLRRLIVAESARYVSFVSGPSRTSDIERELTIGAHGPKALTVILVDGWDLDAA
jgi:L-lactate dehydrogenase complex protein LldG